MTPDVVPWRQTALDDARYGEAMGREREGECDVRDATIMLSKSKFVVGEQCLKRLYWEVHERDRLPPADPLQEARFQQGHEVGEVARRAFPGGVLVEESFRDHEAAMRRTAELMTQPGVNAIFEAAFEHDGVRVRVDVLERRARGRWRLVEVKSTASVKDYHLIDLAIQRHVATGAGVKVESACLMHLNTGYVYDGKSLDVNALFAIEQVDDEVEVVAEGIDRRIKGQFRVLRGKDAPDIDPGPHCEDPWTCPFFNDCNEPPDDDWVGHIPKLDAKKLAMLDDDGIESIRDIDDDFPLSDRQRIAVRAVQKGKPWFGPDLADALDALEYPLFFMDFETHNPAIPRHAGLAPFRPYPFQWSVHVRKRPGGPLTHHEFLATDRKDPREAFAKSLLDVLESAGGDGSIVVYHAPFETGRLNELAAFLPRYAKRIERVKKQIVDLLPIVREHCYHPKFLGSFSIKAVLPALVRGMTYEGMAIGDGQLAAVEFARMIHPETTAKERRAIEKALREYCTQDTLAMVKVLDALAGKAS